MHERATFEHSYRLLQRNDGSLWKLGSGAMGVTYKALDTDLQCPVALKVINSDLMADEVNRNRFLRQARAAAGLRHSNVASVYHLAREGEQFFYAMEFVNGQTTEAYVARHGPMPLRAALRIALQVSKALAAAAKQQLVHRDIKPANVMIVAGSDEEDWPSVKLIDFGLVRSALRAHDSSCTTRSGFLVSAQFASPEQIEESEVDARSDIYSLGCTLWCLLTGEAPFTGSVASVFGQHLGSEPPWEKLRPFPKRVRWLLRRMLRKEPSERPASAVELRREIERCLAHVERREALAARVALALNTARQWLTAAPRTRRVVICSVAVICLMLAFAYRGIDDPSPRSEPAVQTSDVAAATDPANSEEWFGSKNSAWSYDRNWDERLWSSSLARRASYTETIAPHPAAIGAQSSLLKDSISDAEVVQPFAGSGYARSGEEELLLTNKALALSFSIGESENEKVAVKKVRGKNQVKKSTKRSVKKPQRRFASRDRDRGFDPLLEIKQAGESIKRVIRRIF
jgi:Protein kinase domain